MYEEEESDNLDKYFSDVNVISRTNPNKNNNKIQFFNNDKILSDLNLNWEKKELNLKDDEKLKEEENNSEVNNITVASVPSNFNDDSTLTNQSNISTKTRYAKMLAFFNKTIRLRNATTKKNYWKRDYLTSKLI